MVKAGEAVHLVNRSAKLKKMTFLDSTFEIKKVGSQFSGIHHDIRSAIDALKGYSVVDRRSAFTILVSTILTNDFQFNIHMFSKNQMTCFHNKMFPSQCPMESCDLS